MPLLWIIFFISTLQICINGNSINTTNCVNDTKFKSEGANSYSITFNSTQNLSCTIYKSDVGVSDILVSIYNFTRYTEINSTKFGKDACFFYVRFRRIFFDPVTHYIYCNTQNISDIITHFIKRNVAKVELGLEVKKSINVTLQMVITEIFTNSCTPEFRMCGVCLDIDQVCNGEPNCPLGIDETMDACKLKYRIHPSIKILIYFTIFCVSVTLVIAGIMIYKYHTKHEAEKLSKGSGSSLMSGGNINMLNSKDNQYSNINRFEDYEKFNSFDINKTDSNAANDVIEEGDDEESDDEDDDDDDDDEDEAEILVFRGKLIKL